MGKVWIRLNCVKNLETRGVVSRAYPGDYIQVDKSRARQWLAAGDCDIPAREMSKVTKDCAVLCLGSPPENIRALKVPVETGDKPRIVDTYTLIWDPILALRLELVPIGFHLLEKWEVAIPMIDYDYLALDAGTLQERQDTKALIRDLRVPLYDPRLVFVRDCPGGRQFVENWNAEEGDRRLALLRAVYKTKPLICALPITWINKA